MCSLRTCLASIKFLMQFVIEMKGKILETFDARNAEYPAEHNVGHEYFAKDALKNFYRELDPTNSFNPGIGKTTKRKNWAEQGGGCCGGHH